MVEAPLSLEPEISRFIRIVGLSVFDDAASNLDLGVYSVVVEFSLSALRTLSLCSSGGIICVNNAYCTRDKQ
jgi:hypothetical protein